MRTIDTVRITGVLLTLLATDVSPTLAQTRSVQRCWVPEAGLDDPAAYQGYQTRFFRDTKGNVVQVYLDAGAGASSICSPTPWTKASLHRSRWKRQADSARVGSPDATISQTGNRRTIEYQLVANTPQILIGWMLLGPCALSATSGILAAASSCSIGRRSDSASRKS